VTVSQPPKKKSKTTSSKDTEETEAQGLATTLASSGLELTEGWQGAKEPKGNAIMPRLAKLLEQRNADGSKKHLGNDIVAELNTIAKRRPKDGEIRRHGSIQPYRPFEYSSWPPRYNAE